jgi:hypothetical protein
MSDESEYDDGWLTAAERGRISAVKAGSAGGSGAVHDDPFRLRRAQ